ncbi:hypothetical protein BV22DRAFT_867150 [Leucogyrophana mollusca]|uniref:Uncharacterized protein n=1 Tax=Leucogyrophana mollusca TaxID=85980 RepID=A0ACB8B263_9AGAM|nr:hypothetical protein BV22DRAFT_867150 [Leucogyrophana mollusca]
MCFPILKMTYLTTRISHITSPSRTTPSVNHPNLRCYRDALPHALVGDPARRQEGCRDAGEGRSRGSN